MINEYTRTDPEAVNKFIAQYPFVHPILLHIPEKARAIFGGSVSLSLDVVTYPDEPTCLLVTITSSYNVNGTGDRAATFFDTFWHLLNLNAFSDIDPDAGHRLALNIVANAFR